MQARLVEVFCYALSADDGSPWRARIRADADHFLDVAKWPSPSIARRISEDGIHIAGGWVGGWGVQGGASLGSLPMHSFKQSTAIPCIPARRPQHPRPSCHRPALPPFFPVNLNGYTRGARSEVFALRPAPIGVSYMGFPATTGRGLMDYIVTDKVDAVRERESGILTRTGGQGSVAPAMAGCCLHWAVQPPLDARAIHHCMHHCPPARCCTHQ